MAIEPLPIVGSYNLQRFKQYSPEDCANWYLNPAPNAKSPMAMYPAMGRAHVKFLNQNELIFEAEPRGEFDSIKYSYYVVGQQIFRYDANFNRVEISQGKLATLSGSIFFAYLVAGDITFAIFVDGVHIYVSREDTDSFDIITDPNAPPNPKYVAAFGNRITVSTLNSSQYSLSTINLDGGLFNPATAFTIAGSALFAQEAGIIRQMGVLHNTLYIFTDFTTGIWSNQAVSYVVADATAIFPWKKNATYDWDYGIAIDTSLSIGFGRMSWIAQNDDGLLQAMASGGGSPERISNKAIDVLFQRNINANENSPFIQNNSFGFMYQYENTLFYRFSTGTYTGTGLLDQMGRGFSIEFNFDTQSWGRCIEKNGERNRITRHIYFANRHLVTVQGDGTVYEMSGQFYYNEITNPDSTDPQASDAYIQEPFRYERVTPIISEPDYAEFETKYVEIDFVFGESNISFSSTPFANAQWLIGEAPGVDGNPVYLIAEDSDPADPTYLLAEEGNTPVISSLTYNALFKPHIELYFSDDGGISFLPADVLEFSQMGYYQWRMRWYQLGPSRNRAYLLVCVSPVPIVVLGGSMDRERISGGAS